MFTGDNRPKSAGRSEDRLEVGVASLFLLTAVSVILLFLLVTMFVVRKVDSGFITPEVIIEFLTGVTSSEVEVESAVQKYIVGAVDYQGYGSQDGENVRTVLWSYTDDIDGYTIELSVEGYIEFSLLNAQSEPVYPKVALAYTLTEDSSQIVTYTLGRLQPTSVMDEEYSELWR